MHLLHVSLLFFFFLCHVYRHAPHSNRDENCLHSLSTENCLLENEKKKIICLDTETRNVCKVDTIVNSLVVYCQTTHLFKFFFFSAYCSIIFDNS